MSTLVYLHGFASGPEGNKGKHCRRWAELNDVSFLAPDLNLPSFEALTISAQVAAVEALLSDLNEPPVVVGSSLGGLVGAAVAWRGAPVHHLVLLAPAFGFSRRRLVGPRWGGYRRRGTLPVFHHARAEWTHLGPELLDDLKVWADDDHWEIPVPVTILHGRFDASVPLSESEAFLARHPEAMLHALEDDHALLAPATLALLDDVLERAMYGRR